MTKENRERAYKNFRNSEKNYIAPEGKDHSCTSTKNVRIRAKALADRLLIKNPELAELDKPAKEEKPKEDSDPQAAPKPKEKPKPSKSKGAKDGSK